MELFYAYAVNPNAKAHIFISQGRAECSQKYAEVIYDLYHNGFSVFIFDHQGQGKSSRLQANPHIGYVSSFDDYVDDLHAVIEHVFIPVINNSSQGKLAKHLVCHSMGGAIGTGYVQKHPKVFNKLVLLAPMLGINAPLPESMVFFCVKYLLKTKLLFTTEATYFFGQSNYQAFPFEINRLTHCQERYDAFKQLYAQQPDLQLGGVSFEWLYQAIIFMRKLRLNMHTINIPACVMTAENEQIVDNTLIKSSISKMPNCKHHEIEKSKHEILFEMDIPRNQALTLILDFLNAN